MLDAMQINLDLTKSRVTLAISSLLTVISSCSLVYVSSSSLSPRYQLTLGGGNPPITSHNNVNGLSSFTGCKAFV